MTRISSRGICNIFEKGYRFLIIIFTDFTIYKIPNIFAWWMVAAYFLVIAYSIH